METETEIVPATVVSDGETTAVIVEVPETTTDSELEETEVEQEWLDTKFGTVIQAIQAVAMALSAQSELQTRQGEMLLSLHNRLPENLTAMISQQQETIARLVEQVQVTAAATAVTVLSSQNPPAQQAEPQTDHPLNVVEENPEQRTVPIEHQRPKRRRI